MTIAITVLLLLALMACGAAACHYRSNCWPNATASTMADYSRRRPLNSSHRALYRRLTKMLPDHVVLAQVALRRCVVARGSTREIIARESLDFVVCTQTMHVIAAIEIANDRQSAGYRRKAQEVKEEALRAVGIRLIKCTSQSLLSEAYITMEFNHGFLHLKTGRKLSEWESNSSDLHK